MVENTEIIDHYTVRQVIGLRFRLARALMKNIYTKHPIIDNFSQKDVAQYLNEYNKTKSITYNDIANLERGNGLLTNFYSLIIMYRNLGIHLSFFFDKINHINNVIYVPFTPKEGANYKKLNYKINVKYEPTFKESEPQNEIPALSEFVVAAKVIDSITKTENQLIVEDIDTEDENSVYAKALQLLENANRISQKL